MLFSYGTRPSRARSRKGEDRTKKEILRMQDVLLLWRKITRGREQENGAKRRNPVPYRRELALVREASGAQRKIRVST